ERPVRSASEARFLFPPIWGPGPQAVKRPALREPSFPPSVALSLIAHEFEDVSEDFSNRAIQVRGDLLSNVHGFVQCLGQWRILNDRDLIFDRALPNARRQIVLAFGHYQRRSHR